MLVRSIHIFWILFIYTDGAQQDCQNNKLVVYTDNTCITLFSLPPFTNTFGSNLTYRCSSRLQQLPASGLDFCPVEVCQLDGTWTNGYISCGINECYNPGSSICYNGRRTCGISGTLCQSWNSQTPHPHVYTSPNFPEGNITLAKNYCRDPDGVKGQPWCFTTNPNIIWEFCEIATCTDLPVTGGTCEATLPTPPSTTCALAITSTLTTTTTTTTPSTSIPSTITTPSTTSMPETTTTPSTTSMTETTTTPITTSMPETTTTPSTTSMPETTPTPSTTIIPTTTTTPSTTSMPSTTTTPSTTSMPTTTTTPSTTSMPSTTTTQSTTSVPETTTTLSTTSMPEITTTPSTTSMPTTTTTPSTSSSSTSAQTTAPLASVGELYTKFYRKILADLPSYIQIQFMPNIRTMLSCAGNCNKREDCNVYVINPTTKECILYTFNTTGSNIPCSGSYTCYMRYS